MMQRDPCLLLTDLFNYAIHPISNRFGIFYYLRYNLISIFCLSLTIISVEILSLPRLLIV